VWRKSVFDIYFAEWCCFDNCFTCFVHISTRSWYRNINFLRDRIRRIFL
jgi:hypothetical protein